MDSTGIDRIFVGNYSMKNDCSWGSGHSPALVLKTGSFGIRTEGFQFYEMNPQGSTIGFCMGNPSVQLAWIDAFNSSSPHLPPFPRAKMRFSRSGLRCCRGKNIFFKSLQIHDLDITSGAFKWNKNQNLLKSRILVTAQIHQQLGAA